VTPRGKPARGVRRLERWLVGVGFAVIAIVLEQVVLRTVRRGGGQPHSDGHDSRTITSRGGDVDVG
jgi:hypothetical protein